jgi:fatty-acid peroxygenase
MASKGGFTVPVAVYDLIGARCDRLGTDAFAVPVPVVGPVICMRGAEAARLFYDEARFRRADALPRRVRATLVGEGAVQTLDDDVHRRRKRLHMGLMSPDAVAELDACFADTWARHARRWRDDGGRVVLYDALGLVLCEAVCAWAGIPLAAGEVAPRTADLHAMIETPLAFGPTHRRGRRARRRAERWAGDLIARVRAGTLAAPPGRALAAVAEHRAEDGEPLDLHTAAVELLNVVRPTVALDRFIVFVAAALHEHRHWADRLRHAAPDDPVFERFVHEVRRHYPFFPLQGARVRTPFRWHDIEFPAGALTVLDLHGTNHDPARWEHPDRFDPDRFLGGDIGPFDLVPQGGGEHWTGHRCAGEWLTVRLLTTATRVLGQQLDYDVPPQDLRVSHRKVPALPNSGFVISDVRAAVTPAPAG